MQTNPAYLELVKRRAIFGEVIATLVRDYTPAYGGEPSKKIVCEDLPVKDAEVEALMIQRFINELQQQEESLRLELLKFEFTRKDDGKQESNRAQGHRGAHAQAAQKGRQRVR